MRLLLARIILRLFGTVDATVWGHDDYPLVSSNEEDVIWLHVGRHWVTAWTLWWDDINGDGPEWRLSSYRYPVSAVKSIVTRGRDRDL